MTGVDGRLRLTWLSECAGFAVAGSGRGQDCFEAYNKVASGPAQRYVGDLASLLLETTRRSRRGDAQSPAPQRAGQDGACHAAQRAPSMEPLIAPRQPRCASPDELLTFVIAYVELLVAAWQAAEQQPRSHSRPVPLALLEDKGVSRDVLLWLLYQGHVEHLGATTTTNGSDGLVIRDSLTLDEGSSFALTKRGEAFANLFLVRILFSERDSDFESTWAMLTLGELLPSYQPEERQFAWGRHVLKSFRQPAANQEIILSAAEEMGWPDWFDDPLPRRGRNSPKARLHDTIKDLNRRQRLSFVRFKGDGTGTRVGWELR
jgi:hypothetical protein